MIEGSPAVIEGRPAVSRLLCFQKNKALLESGTELPAMRKGLKRRVVAISVA